MRSRRRERLAKKPRPFAGLGSLLENRRLGKDCFRHRRKRRCRAASRPCRSSRAKYARIRKRLALRANVSANTGIRDENAVAATDTDYSFAGMRACFNLGLLKSSQKAERWISPAGYVDVRHQDTDRRAGLQGVRDFQGCSKMGGERRLSRA